MRPNRHSPWALLRRFRRAEDGVVMVEGLLMLPILIWCFVGAHVFFDAFRAKSTNIRAAYTIGDALSRETGYITPQYLDSVHDLQQFLVDTDEAVRLRVTMLHYDGPTDRYLVNWSRTRGGVAELDTAGLAQLRSIMPAMPNRDIGILVETWVDYLPGYEVGLDPFTFEDKVVTRPRFAGQLCWNSSNNGGPSTATC